MASSRQGKKELRQLVERVGPTVNEFYDAFLVLGVRAGDHDHSTHAIVAPTADLQLRVENTILALAQDIVIRRDKAQKP